MQISSKILPQIPNFASFSLSENEAISAVSVTAVNLFYEVLQNSSRLLAFTFLKENKKSELMLVRRATTSVSF